MFVVYLKEDTPHSGMESNLIYKYINKELTDNDKSVRGDLKY